MEIFFWELLKISWKFSVMEAICNGSSDILKFCCPEQFFSLFSSKLNFIVIQTTNKILKIVFLGKQNSGCARNKNSLRTINTIILLIPYLYHQCLYIFYTNKKYPETSLFILICQKPVDSATNDLNYKWFKLLTNSIFGNV